MITGADCSAAGKIGQACSFNGRTYISVPDATTLNVGADFSIALWINPSIIPGSGSYFYFLQRGPTANRLFMSLGSGSRMTVGVADLYWGSNKAFQTGTWYHVVYTHQGSSDTEKLYINGVLDKSQGSRTKDAYNTGNLLLGRRDTGTDTSYSYKGLLDEVRIYNRVLTQADITELANPSCTPNCAGKVCGDNGCGGSCGACTEGICTNGQCVVIPETNLVAYYKFDSDANDYSGNNYHGTNNGATSVSGLIGNAYQFDANDYISLGTGPSLSGTTDFSVSAWIKTSAKKNQVIIQQRDAEINGEYQLKITPEGRISWMLYNGDYQFGYAANQMVNDGQWHNIIAKRNSTGGYIYIDGVLDSFRISAARSLNNLISTVIGRDIRDNTDSFEGLIDEVKIYSKDLTEADVISLYSQGGQTNPPEIKNCDYLCRQAILGGYDSYEFEHTGFKKLETIFNFVSTPKQKAVGYYPALMYSSFEAGLQFYSGPQLGIDSNGKTIHNLLFAIWAPNDGGTTAHIYQDEYASHCEEIIQGIEGTTAACSIIDDPTQPNKYHPVTWQEGKRYKFTIELYKILADGAVWEAKIQDLETKQETIIGRLKLDNVNGYNGYGLISSTVGFLEYYGGAGDCLNAEYGKMIREGTYADGKWIPKIGRATRPILCTRSAVSSTRPGVIVEEFGQGVSRTVDPSHVYRDGETLMENIPLWQQDKDIEIEYLP